MKTERKYPEPNRIVFLYLIRSNPHFLVRLYRFRFRISDVSYFKCKSRKRFTHFSTVFYFSTFNLKYSEFKIRFKPNLANCIGHTAQLQAAHHAAAFFLLVASCPLLQTAPSLISLIMYLVMHLFNAMHLNQIMHLLVVNLLCIWSCTCLMLCTVGRYFVLNFRIPTVFDIIPLELVRFRNSRYSVSSCSFSCPACPLSLSLSYFKCKSRKRLRSFSTEFDRFHPYS